MSLFGKKAASPAQPAAPALNVPGAPPAPPFVKATASSAGVRKRITQRLVLGGKGAETGAISKGSGMKIPGVPDAVTSQSLPTSNFTGTVDVPVECLLSSVPAEFVVTDHESLYQSPLAKEMVRLPLSVVLPLLPAGKIEVLAQDLYSYMPEGVMKSAEELGDYAYSPVSLPLPEVISRIPEGALTLRSDQKPIDSSVSGMDDPFSAEMLAAAQEEAKKAQAEAEAEAQTAEDAAENFQEEAPEATELVPPLPEMSAQEETVSPSLEAEMEQEEVPEEPLEVQAASGEATAEGDLSFTKSPEYLEMLRQMEEENQQQEAGEESGQEVEPGAQLEEEAPVSDISFLTDDVSDTEVTKIIPKANQESFDSEPSPEEEPLTEEEPSENPLFAPTRIMQKAEPAPQEVIEPAPAVPPQVEKPEASTKPEPPTFKLPETLPSPAQGEAPKMDFSFKVPPKPEVLPAKAPASPEPEIYKVSGKLAQLLGIRGAEAPTLKDIVHQINTWPGMKGCIVGGKDGLRISSEVEDDTFANSISAFAPKLISTISDLFSDLGFDDVEEMHTPVKDSSVYIFRKQDLYLIVLFEDTSFPESYRTRIKQVMAEIGSAK